MSRTRTIGNSVLGNSVLNNRVLANSVLAVALAAGLICVGALVPGAPAVRADTPVVLPDGHDELTAPDGVVISVDRTGEHATISPSMAASPLSRNVWVSGVATAHVGAPAGVRVTGGVIETGYLLGCQVDLGKGGSVGSGDGGASVGPNSLSPYLDPSMNLKLAPGKVTSVKVDSFEFHGASGTTQYIDRTLAVEGCAGYAQARAYTTVTVHDSVMDDSQTLWGAPFSVG